MRWVKGEGGKGKGERGKGKTYFSFAVILSDL
jgi:hypothetical protein